MLAPKAEVENALKRGNWIIGQPFVSARSDMDLHQVGWSGVAPFVGSTVTSCYYSGKLHQHLTSNPRKRKEKIG
jgi:hypothetical protein